MDLQETEDTLAQYAIEGLYNDPKEARAKIAALLGTLLLAGREWLKGLIEGTWEKELSRFPGPVGPEHLKAAQLLAESGFSRLEEMNAQILRRADDLFRKVEVARLSGETWRQTAKRLEEELRARGLTAFKDSLGREYSLSSYTKMLSRSVISQARIEAARLRLIENGHDLAVIGGPVPGQRPACKRHAGATVSLTGKTPGYMLLQTYIDEGGFGPNCRHYLTI